MEKQPMPAHKYPLKVDDIPKEQGRILKWRSVSGNSLNIDMSDHWMPITPLSITETFE